MPVKRRSAKARQHQVTDEALRAFRVCDEILKSGKYDDWEDVGGRHREYLDTLRVLYRELKPPWNHASPLDDDLEGPPPYGPETCWAMSRPAALEIRREIFCGAEGKMNPTRASRRSALSETRQPRVVHEGMRKARRHFFDLGF